MPKSQSIRRTIVWSKATDEALLSFLGPTASDADDLSRFVEDSVRWRMFDQTTQAVKLRNASEDPERLQEIIDTSVREVRREMSLEAMQNESQDAAH